MPNEYNIKMDANELLALRQKLPHGAIKAIANKLGISRHIVKQNLIPKVNEDYREDVIKEAREYIHNYGVKSN